MERRHFSRIPFANRAEIEAGAIRVQGQVTDLSLNGLRLISRKALPDQTDVTVHLQLGADGSDFVLHLPARVLRYRDGALAVQFNLLTIDDQTLTILKRILALFHGDGQVVEREYRNYLTLLLRRKKKLRKQARKKAAREGEGEDD